MNECYLCYRKKMFHFALSRTCTKNKTQQHFCHWYATYFFKLRFALVYFVFNIQLTATMCGHLRMIPVFRGRGETGTPEENPPSRGK